MSNPNAYLNSKFVPGVSGNPAGRPPRPLPSHLEKARAAADRAIDTLIKMMQESDDWAQRGWAAERLLDRAWGKPVQLAAVESSNDVNILVNVLLGRAQQATIEATKADDAAD